MSATESTPLITASAAPDTSNDAVLARAIAHEFNSYEEFASEVRKGTRVVEAQRWDDYYRDPDHVSLRYSAWRGPDGEIIHTDDDGPDPGLVACFWLTFLLFLLAIIIIPFYL